MPHRCMDCKNTIESGALDLKEGCPICGCKKFQYVRPKKAVKASPTVAEYVADAAEKEPAMVTEPAKHVSAEPVAEPEKAAPAPEGPRIESIRIIEPGTYDINLSMLLSRKELVMSKEEGSYFVDLKSALKQPKKKKSK